MQRMALNWFFYLKTFSVFVFENSKNNQNIYETFQTIGKLKIVLEAKIINID